MAEYTIDPTMNSEIRALLESSFPGFFRDRIYYKQVPSFRCLVRCHGKIVAQVGVVYRVIRVGERAVTIFGLADLCVDEAHRGKGLASRLLEEVESLALLHHIDTLVLLADDHRLYLGHGFEAVKRPCTWLGIDEHRSLGMRSQNLGDCLLVKLLDDQPWPQGEIDFLGFLF